MRGLVLTPLDGGVLVALVFVRLYTCGAKDKPVKKCGEVSIHDPHECKGEIEFIGQ